MTPALDDSFPPRPLLHAHASKPAYQLPFTPPVLFYRRPDDLNVGIIETLAAMPDASVAIDPLCGKDWREFIRACRSRGRTVYGWTRCPSILEIGYLCDSGLDGYFPNIEDDDLRAHMDSRDIYLQIVFEALHPLGVLTNYFVSDEWPARHALAELPVLPEWFPREITDATATLEGSLDSGRQHFAAAIPLLDGRERGLEAFPYPAGSYCVWPADNVTDWSKWRRP